MKTVDLNKRSLKKPYGINQILHQRKQLDLLAKKLIEINKIRFWTNIKINQSHYLNLLSVVKK